MGQGKGIRWHSRWGQGLFFGMLARKFGSHCSNKRGEYRGLGGVGEVGGRKIDEREKGNHFSSHIFLHLSLHIFSLFLTLSSALIFFFFSLSSLFLPSLFITSCSLAILLLPHQSFPFLFLFFPIRANNYSPMLIRDAVENNRNIKSF